MNISIKEICKWAGTNTPSKILLVIYKQNVNPRFLQPNRYNCQFEHKVPSISYSEMPRDLDSVILQLYARTPAPCRDYCGLTITTTDAILNIWNVTFGPHAYPRRHTCSLENFEHDKYFQMEVHRVFGENVYEYVMSLSKNQINLQNLPTKVFLRILRFLAAKDIIHLSQTSKIMFEVIRKRRKVMKRNPDRHDKHNANACGWKETLKQKRILQGRKIGSASTRSNVNRTGMQGRGNFMPNNIKVIQKRDIKATIPGQVINKTNIDYVKSTSALSPSKLLTQKTLKKPDQFKTVVNLTQIYPIPKSFSQTKNELKTSNLTRPVKNLVNNPLEKSANVKVAPTNLRPADRDSTTRINSATPKNKIDAPPRNNSATGKNYNKPTPSINSATVKDYSTTSRLNSANVLNKSNAISRNNSAIIKNCNKPTPRINSASVKNKSDSTPIINSASVKNKSDATPIINSASVKNKSDSTPIINSASVKNKSDATPTITSATVQNYSTTSRFSSTNVLNKSNVISRNTSITAKNISHVIK